MFAIWNSFVCHLTYFLFQIVARSKYGVDIVSDLFEVPGHFDSIQFERIFLVENAHSMRSKQNIVL